MRAVCSDPAFGIGTSVLARFVAANLSYYLKKRGLKQRDLARHVGVADSAVSGWLGGERLPRDHHWPKILEALGCTLEDMVKDPSGRSTNGKPDRLPPKDRDPVVRYLRRQAHEVGYDLVKIREEDLDS